MEWLKPLRGRTVALDTAPFIYFIEKHSLYLPVLQPFFEAVADGEIEIVTSTLTLTEVLIHPIRHGNQALARRYASILLNAAHVTTLGVSPAIAIEAAQLRAIHGYKTPDAIHLATALSAHAGFFLTNDDAFLSTSSLQVLVLKQLAP